MDIGSVLAGKYRIDRILGRGGMGIVVQAMHLQLGQPVAVKFLLPEVLGNREVVQRFLREAQAAVRLRSEHVARVIDVGTLETSAPYMVLEYLDGTDLAHVPPSHLNPGVIVDLMLQACEALAEAHSLGIVHRDIKPANFFLTRRNDGSSLLKILDFGISKASTALDSGITGTQVVMGTPAYMSPEQMKSARDVDHRSDIWSLGIVLYQLLEGAAPFEAETFTSLCIKVATEPLRPMKKQLPPGLTQVVYRCLEKDPALRFADVGQLARALAPYAKSATQAAISVERTSHVSRGGVTNMTMPETASATPTTLSGSAVAMTPAPSTTSRRRWPLVVGTTAVLGGIVAFAIVASSGGGNEVQPAAAPAATAPTADSPPLTAPVTPPAAAATPPAAQPATNTASTTTAPTTTAPTAAVTTTAPPAATTPPTNASTPTPAVTTSRPSRTSSKKSTKATTTTATPTTTAKGSAATTPTPPATQPVKPAATPPPNNSSDDILGTRN